MGNDRWKGGGGDGNSIINTLSSCLLQFVRGFFCTESIIRKKKWPSTEQATNETVAKKILEVTFCKSRQISVAVYFIISVNFFFFHLYLGMVMYVNEFETRENKN